MQFDFEKPQDRVDSKSLSQEVVLKHANGWIMKINQLINFINSFESGNSLALFMVLLETLIQFHELQW